MTQEDPISAPTRPKLSMPAEEAAWLRDHYARARSILEYGSGGSTILAGEQLGTHVFSVESDLDWAANLAGWFDANPPRANVQMHPVDIGKTEKWGRPAGHSGWRRYHRYPISVWDREDFQAPDVVLIDGRFRAACFLTVMVRTSRPVTVLFDDYIDRDAYHMVERYVKPSEIRGRMARFDVTPRAFPVEDMALFFESFSRVL